MRDSRRYRIAIHTAAVLVSLIFLVPFAWLVIASLASQSDLLKIPLSFIPSHLSFSRYTQIFTSQSGTIFANFRASLINSLIIATSTVAISITVGVFGAYAFARLRFRGQRASLLLFLSTYMVPPIALVIPLYLIMVKLHLLNTRIGLIIVYCTFATPASAETVDALAQLEGAPVLAISAHRDSPVARDADGWLPLGPRASAGSGAGGSIRRRSSLTARHQGGLMAASVTVIGCVQADVVMSPVTELPQPGATTSPTT